MRVLRAVYGDGTAGSVPEPTDWAVTHWELDPYARGSYSYISVGASGDDLDVLAAPVAAPVDDDGADEGTDAGAGVGEAEDVPRLFWAGEATNRTHPASVHGAYLSGEREARRIAALCQDLAARAQPSPQHPRAQGAAGPVGPSAFPPYPWQPQPPLPPRSPTPPPPPPPPKPARAKRASAPSPRGLKRAKSAEAEAGWALRERVIGMLKRPGGLGRDVVDVMKELEGLRHQHYRGLPCPKCAVLELCGKPFFKKSNQDLAGADLKAVKKTATRPAVGGSSKHRRGGW